MDEASNITARVIVVHRRGGASRRLAGLMERALGRLGSQTMVVDAGQTPLTDELGSHASPAASTIAASFRPDVVVLCAPTSSIRMPWDLPTIAVSDGTDGDTGSLQLPPELDVEEQYARVADAMACALGRTSDNGTAFPIRTVLVSGYFGAGNRGDDVIVSTLLEAIEALPNTRVVLASPLPHRAIADYGRPAFDRLNLVQCDRWASIASAVLLGPGGLWDDYSIGSVGGLAGVVSGAVRSPAHLVQLPILVKGYGGRFRGVGLGAGPLRDEASRAAVRLSIELADHVDVRDEESRELLTEIAPAFAERIGLVPDLAWAVNLSDQPEHSDLPWVPDTPWIVFNVRPWGDNRAQQQAWNETCTVAAEKALAIVCVPMQDQDAAMMRSFEPPEEVQVSHMPIDASQAEFMATLAGAEAVVAMRLHTSILGHVAATPGVAVSYHPKVTSHYADVGRGDYVVDVEFVPGELAHRVRRALGQGVGELHAARVRERRRAAQDSLEQLCTYLGALPGVAINEVWDAVPPSTSRRATLELSGALVQLRDAAVSGHNLLLDERVVSIESGSTDKGGLVIAMTDRSPHRGDTVQAMINISTPAGHAYRVSLHLQTRCGESDTLTGRMVHEVLVEDTLVLTMDCAEWKPRTSLWITGVAKAGSTSLTIRTRALRDCEDWGWGASAALTIEAVSTEPWDGRGEHTSSSNPFAITAPPP